eukprot:COSAG01_NODE_8704_length_2691_cov_1.604552_1_plen_381_part_00
MSGRSRRSSTVASSKATEALRRQRDQEEEQQLVVSSSIFVEGRKGKAEATKQHDGGPATAPVAKKKRRRNRGQGWSRPAKRGVTTRRYVILRKPRTSRPRRSNKKRARCTFAAGLERFPNQPCTSSYGGFLDGEDSVCSSEATDMAAVKGRICGKLAWLRPRHTTSIWERIARNQQDAALLASKTHPGNDEHSANCAGDQLSVENLVEKPSIGTHLEESRVGNASSCFRRVQPNGNTVCFPPNAVEPEMPTAGHQDVDSYSVAPMSSKEVMLGPIIHRGVVLVDNHVPVPVGIVTPQLREHVGLPGTTSAQMSGTSLNTDASGCISQDLLGAREASWLPGVADLTDVVPASVNVIPVNRTNTHVADVKSERGRISILSLC